VLLMLLPVRAAAAESPLGVCASLPVKPPSLKRDLSTSCQLFLLQPAAVGAGATAFATPAQQEFAGMAH